MENQFTIRSKIFLRPKRRIYIFKIILNICLIIILIAGVLNILFDGFSFYALGGICIPAIIVQNYKNRPQNKEHYEFCMINLLLHDSYLQITHLDLDKHDGKGLRNETITIDYDKITSLDYSSRLVCFRICGLASLSNTLSSKTEMQNLEYYLYIELELERSIINAIERNTKLIINYMDQ